MNQLKKCWLITSRKPAPFSPSVTGKNLSGAFFQMTFTKKTCCLAHLEVIDKGLTHWPLVKTQNHLTRVPSTNSTIIRSSSVGILTQFPLLNNVDLSSNAITSLIPHDFNLTAPLIFLDLSSNNISSAAPGSLPSISFIFSILIDSKNCMAKLRGAYSTGATIWLDNNQRV